MRALSRLKESDLADSSEKKRGMPLTHLLSSLLCIVLCALSRNAVFTASVLACAFLYTAFLPVRSMRNILGSLALPCLFTALIMLPAVFMGSPKTMLTVTMKVAEAVLVLGILNVNVSWKRLTEAFREIHIPDLFVLVLDQTLRYLVILGRYSNSLLEAVTMRSVGKLDWKRSGAGGILGTTFLKSQQMAAETEEAMRLRGFQGEYRSVKKDRFGVWDALLLAVDAVLLLFFAYTQRAMR